MKKKILISSGINNYHMLFTASEINKRKKLSYLFCGPYPLKKYLIFLKKINFLKPIKRLINRKHNIKEIYINDLWIPELLSQINVIIQKILSIKFLNDKLDYLSFKLFQNLTLKFILKCNLNNVSVFHFRSGYGGKIINYLNKKKIITLCDHGIVHPKILDYLTENKGKFPLNKNFILKKNFWMLVNEDLEKSDYILANSNFVKKTLTYFGIPQNKIFVVYQGIENKFIKQIPKIKSLKKKSKKIKVLFSGTLTLRKGILDIQKSLYYLKNSNIELHLAGNIDHRIKSALNTLLDNKKVIYHGLLDKKSLAHLMCNSDIFIFPSYAEGSARVIFEAMVCGCVIITTKNSGSIVKNKINGTIIKPGKPNEIANAIKHYVNKKKLIRKISINNKKLILRNFNQKIYGDKLIKIYKKINA